MMIKNSFKNGAIGTTMVWIFALFAILLILLAYLLGVSSLAVQGKSSEYFDKINNFFSASKTVSKTFFTKEETDNLISFVDSEVDSNDEQKIRKLLFDSYDIFYEKRDIESVIFDNNFDIWEKVYLNTENYFDNVYDECYFLCFYFISNDEIFQIKNIASKNCDIYLSNLGSELIVKNNYQNWCNDFNKDITKSSFSKYSQLWLLNTDTNKEVIKINLFVGGSNKND
ncbi:MAG TPA: hypothetical protein P5277_03800 [Candidatus Paceibacterota bacterium]|nr:hypothetical protein [Candidatus Paceibacterota bacterium]